MGVSSGSVEATKDRIISVVSVPVMITGAGAISEADTSVVAVATMVCDGVKKPVISL